MPTNPVESKSTGTSERTAPGRESHMTRQKRAVAALLAETDQFTSAQELHARLRNSGEKVGLATVYNQLGALVEASEVDTRRGESGETLYRRCGLVSHHHHLICRRCGLTVELSAPEVETWARELGRRNGFNNLDHVLEITGICDRCSDDRQ